MSPQQKLILFPSLSLIALCLFGWLFVYPLVNKIKTASQEYLTNQEALNRLNQREALAKELQKSYQEREADLEAIAKVFLESGEIVGFISNLEAIAQETGNLFEIKAVSPYQVSDKGERPSLSFRISLWGDFPSLLSFLANLENSPYPPYRLVEIENLAVKRIAAGGLLTLELTEGALETILDVKIYTQ